MTGSGLSSIGHRIPDPIVIMSGYSLFDELTKLKPNGEGEVPSAVQLVEFLLRGVGMDACDSDCNAQAMYRLSVRSKGIANRIIELTDKVLKETDEHAFVEYNKLINPLEELLFRVAMIPQRDHKLHREIKVETHSILLQPFSEWYHDRQQVRLSLRSVHRAEFKEYFPLDQSDTKDYPDAMAYDDVACLRSAAKDLCDYKHHEPADLDSPDDAEVPALIDEVAKKIEELASSLSDKPIHDEDIKTYDPSAEDKKAGQAGEDKQDPYLEEATRDAEGLPFRAAFVLSGILTRGGLEDKEWERWRTKESWVQAKGLMGKIVKAVKSGDPQSSKEELRALAGEWKAYELWLLGEVDIMRQSILDLMKYVAMMHRPYYFRAFALVQESLWLEKLTQKDARTRDQYMTFIIPAEKALKNASNKPAAVETFDWATITADKVYTDFGEVERLLQKAFTVFGRDVEWKQSQEAIDMAKLRDEAGVKHATTGFEAIKKRADRDAKKVKVKVKVCGEPEEGADLTLIDTKELDVDPPERLDAILWKMRANCEELLKLKPQFYKDGEGEAGGKKVKVDRHEKLGEVGSGDLTLYLSITDSTKWTVATAPAF